MNNTFAEEVSEFDTYGPRNEESISTQGYPIEAAVLFAGMAEREYQPLGTYPFTTINNQLKHSNFGLRATDTASYLINAHHAAEKADTYGPTFKKLRDDDTIRVNSCITSSHREIAQQIRDYYKSTFTMWKLQSRSLSNWQSELFDIVSREDIRAYKSREIPLISKLVQAYEIDLETDRCVDKWGGNHRTMLDDLYAYHPANVVGAFCRLREGGLSVFALTEDELLIELVLRRSPVNNLFIDVIERQGFTGFQFKVNQVKRFSHINGKTWLKSYTPELKLS